MNHPSTDFNEGEEVAAAIAPYPTVRATVAPWVAGFASGGTRRGHNVIWLWSESEAFPAQRFEQQNRPDRIAALRRFLATLPRSDG